MSFEEFRKKAYAKAHEISVRYDCYMEDSEIETLIKLIWFSERVDYLMTVSNITVFAVNYTGDLDFPTKHIYVRRGEIITFFSFSYKCHNALEEVITALYNLKVEIKGD